MTAMVRTLLLASGVCACLSVPMAQAAQWREVGQVPATGTRVFVDDDSLTVDHDTVVKGWVRFEYARPREQDGYPLNASASLRMVNCETHRYWLMEGWGYRSNAEPVPLFSTSREWQAIGPDSENEIASAAMCYEASSIFRKLWDKLKSLTSQ